MTDSFRIFKVPDVDNIFVNHIYAAFQSLTSEGLTGSEATPISYVCQGTLSEHTRYCWADIYYSRYRPTLENGMR
jgi:hypothetical protein